MAEVAKQLFPDEFTNFLLSNLTQTFQHRSEVMKFDSTDEIKSTVLNIYDAYFEQIKCFVLEKIGHTPPSTNPTPSPYFFNDGNKKSKIAQLWKLNNSYYCKALTKIYILLRDKDDVSKEFNVCQECVEHFCDEFKSNLVCQLIVIRKSEQLINTKIVFCNCCFNYIFYYNKKIIDLNT